eukprot:4477756-Amphidinium_carterae.1
MISGTQEHTPISNKLDSIGKGREANVLLNLAATVTHNSYCTCLELANIALGTRSTCILKEAKSKHGDQTWYKYTLHPRNLLDKGHNILVASLAVYVHGTDVEQLNLHNAGTVQSVSMTGPTSPMTNFCSGHRQLEHFRCPCTHPLLLKQIDLPLSAVALMHDEAHDGGVCKLIRSQRDTLGQSSYEPASMINIGKAAHRPYTPMKVHEEHDRTNNSQNCKQAKRTATNLQENGTFTEGQAVLTRDNAKAQRPIDNPELPSQEQKPWQVAT